MTRVLPILIFGIGLSNASNGAQTITIADLPNAAEELDSVCYNESGALSRCAKWADIPVDCGADESLQQAIDALPPTGWMNLVISGECSEDIYLNRKNTVLKSADPANKANIKTQNEPLTVDGPINVNFEYIKVSEGMGGIILRYGAQANFTGVEIANNSGTSDTYAQGLQLYLNAGAELGPDNTIGPNGESPALVVYNGSHISIWGENNTITSDESAYKTIYMADGSLGLWNPLSITGGFALFNGSTLEMSQGITFAGGKSSYISSGSVARLTGAIHTGNIKIVDSTLFTSGGYNTDPIAPTTIGGIELDWNATVLVDEHTTFSGGSISGSSFMTLRGALASDLIVKPSASVEATSTANLDSNTLYLCGIADDGSSVDATAAGTGTIEIDCSALPTAASNKSATLQQEMLGPRRLGLHQSRRK